MRKKVKYFIAITILSAIALLFLIISAGTFAAALATIKKGGAAVIGGILILAIFAISLGVSAILAVVDMPFTIISIKKSESKVYPIILLVIESIIIVSGITLLILLILHK